MPERLGRYIIESEIGKGGMGVVYRARDVRLGKVVALKVLSDPESVSHDARHRLRQEARAAATLNHPAIATAFDYDEQDGVPFIVYEYIEGRGLDRIIAEEKLDPNRIIDIAAQIAGGLAYAHERGILHRDIKPQNVLVTPEGMVKILDFGLAKRTNLALMQADGKLQESTTIETAAGTIVGTVQYMSPEQIAGDVLDARTDIFSLGILIYEMAARKNPFQGQTFGSTIGRIMSLDPPPLSGEGFQIPPELQDIVRKCLEKKREERYPSAKTLRGDLDHLRSGRVPVHSPARPMVTSISVIPRPTARVSLILLQCLYLGIYAFALYYHKDVFDAVAKGIAYLHYGDIFSSIPSARLWTSALLITACCGIAVRFYILASAGFDDPETGRQFRKLFPALLVLDEIWALSPLLLVEKWPAGLTVICVCILAYLPFTHRNLIASAYESEVSS